MLVGGKSTVRIIFNLLVTWLDITVSSMSLMTPNLAAAESTSTLAVARTGTAVSDGWF